MSGGETDVGRRICGCGGGLALGCGPASLLGRSPTLPALLHFLFPMLAAVSQRDKQASASLCTKSVPLPCRRQWEELRSRPRLDLTPPPDLAVMLRCIVFVAASFTAHNPQLDWMML